MWKVEYRCGMGLGLIKVWVRDKVGSGVCKKSTGPTEGLWFTVRLGSVRVS